MRIDVPDIAAKNCYFEDTASLPDVNPCYFRMEFIVASHTLASTEFKSLILARDNGASPIFREKLLNNAGTLTLRLNIWHSGTENTYDGTYALSLDTRHWVEVKWDGAANVWAWRIDGVEQDNGTITVSDRDEIGRMNIGPVAGDSTAALEMFIDNITFADNDWIGLQEQSTELAISQTVPEPSASALPGHDRRRGSIGTNLKV